MEEKKTKAIRDIEGKMEELDEASLRYQVLEKAKSFKTSWLSLGQMLYSVWKNKMHKDWGYGEFDIYTRKEVGIRKETALKLLRSYSFLETSEPKYITKEYTEESEPAGIPSYESVDVLRRASKNKNIEKEDYDNLKKSVFEKGKEAKELRKELNVIVKKSTDLDPEEANEKKKNAAVRRLISILRSVKSEFGKGALPPEIIKEADKLIEMLEEEVPNN
ncbi:MAG TPA: hypothetical protein PKY78_06630 [Candidatus Omnitrophota bacterium]|nr:hypothetical protein [Candidatus Omnitrophota bacterium]HPS20643.1 hypothetical protein [Candidatus Omnitrophota bacterium]